jgi:hypothetical protein
MFHGRHRRHGEVEIKQIAEEVIIWTYEIRASSKKLKMNLLLMICGIRRSCARVVQHWVLAVDDVKGGICLSAYNECAAEKVAELLSLIHFLMPEMCVDSHLFTFPDEEYGIKKKPTKKKKSQQRNSTIPGP